MTRIGKLLQRWADALSELLMPMGTSDEDAFCMEAEV